MNYASATLGVALRALHPLCSSSFDDALARRLGLNGNESPAAARTPGYLPTLVHLPRGFYLLLLQPTSRRIPAVFCEPRFHEVLDLARTLGVHDLVSQLPSRSTNKWLMKVGILDTKGAGALKF